MLLRICLCFECATLFPALHRIQSNRLHLIFLIFTHTHKTISKLLLTTNFFFTSFSSSCSHLLSLPLFFSTFNFVFLSSFLYPSSLFFLSIPYFHISLLFAQFLSSSTLPSCPFSITASLSFPLHNVSRMALFPQSTTRSLPSFPSLSCSHSSRFLQIWRRL